MAETTEKLPPITFDTEPSRYKHWKLTFDGAIATLAMNVQEDGGLRPGYTLKLNSYDLGVDIELADAINRLRFEHPEVRCVVVTSLREKIFCAGANIVMLGLSSHHHKVNFCKFTNETRNGLEDASLYSGIKFLCALNGTASGGGYEMALACDEIDLIDDGNSAVSLPEVPLLGVLPGTGGLTRVVDKRKVRRDHADVFCTVSEGMRGDRAVEWKLVDNVFPKSKFAAAIAERAKKLAETSKRPAGVPGIVLPPLNAKIEANLWTYANVTVKLDRAKRIAELTVLGPKGPQPENPEGIVAAGAAFWPIAAFRELDDALLRLRFNEPELGLLVLRAKGDRKAVLSIDRTLAKHREHWLVNETIGLMRRTLKRVDMMAKTIYALIDGTGSALSGSLFELALAADRIYMLDDDEEQVAIALSPMNNGFFPMANGLTRLQTRFWGEGTKPEELLNQDRPFSTAAALGEGLVTFAPDVIDWDDEVRLAIEERASMSPDALTGMEANLRWPGPETMETKIFARLTAWQNWIFQRPNAVGEKGALKVYGKAGMKAEFDWKRV